MRRFVLCWVAIFMVIPMVIQAEQGSLVGYYQSWRGVPTDAQLDKLNHVIMFQIYPNTDGSGLVTDWWSLSSTKLKDFTTKAHSKGVKVIAGLGGSGGATANFKNATNTANRAKFVKVLKDFVTTNNLDGIDLDWESQVDWRQFLYLLLEMKAAMPDKRISATFGADSPKSEYGNHITKDAILLNEFKTKIWAIDAIQLMTYDMDGKIGDITWTTSADANASFKVIQNWATFGQGQPGFSKEKIFVGIHMSQDNGTSAAKKAGDSRKNGFGGAILWEINDNILPPAHKAIADAGGHIGGTTPIIPTGSAKHGATSNITAQIHNGILKLSAVEGYSIGNVQIALLDIRGRMLFTKQQTVTHGSAEIALPQTVRNQIVVLQITGENGITILQKLQCN